MSILRRSAKVTEATPPPLPSGPVHAALCLPAVQEFLTLSAWDDGAKRQRGTLSISWPEERFVLWANDKDGYKSACVSAVSLEELFLAFERKLTDDSLEWRRLPQKFGGKAGK